MLSGSITFPQPASVMILAVSLEASVIAIIGFLAASRLSVLPGKHGDFHSVVETDKAKVRGIDNIKKFISWLQRK